MCPQDKEILIRRYDVPGARTFSNYWWGTIALVGGIGFLLAGLYSYILNFLISPENFGKFFININFYIQSFFKNTLHLSIFSLNNDAKESLSESSIDIAQNLKILFFPQGLSMCFYGLIGLLVGGYLWFCIFFQIGCGFTEFNKKTGYVKIFRLGFPGKKRVINYTYTLENIQCICVKIPSGIVPVSQRGIYMRLNLSENQTRDIPLDLYSEKTSLENIELQAADLSKFLRVSLSIV